MRIYKDKSMNEEMRSKLSNRKDPKTVDIGGDPNFTI
jgi:hypothetical protein